jgi:CelD/BcsL family acetyltransferase involved in cellulose biosynthesis
MPAPRSVAQTDAWVGFLAETQSAAPVLARVDLDGETVGWFTGLTARRFALKLLGSPLPGWSTPYMGFSLTRPAPGSGLMRGLVEYAFGELGCHHLEVLDRSLALEDAAGLGLEHTMLRGFEVDLTGSEEEVFGRMTGACRRAIRKAEKSRVVVDEASDPGFADDYYSQLREVFARQGLVPPYRVERVRQLIKHLLPTGMLLLLRARTAEGECIATGIFPAMGDCMHFWGGASRLDLRHVRPNEAIQWHAMRYWRSRGVARYDMGGDGAYKAKYGGRRIAVPWFRKSRYRPLAVLRDAARLAYAGRQRLWGVSGPRGHH